MTMDRMASFKASMCDRSLPISATDSQSPSIYIAGSPEFEAGEGGVRMTVNRGFALMPDKIIGSVSEWVAAANAARYEAKTVGRNRVTVYLPNHASSVQAAALTLAA